MCVCMWVCVCVRYRNQNHWTDLDEILHWILLKMGKVHSWVATPYPDPQVRGALNRV
jgi:hypothetical protein